MSLRILGTLECRRDGEVVDLGGSRPKRIMALLAMERGRVVGRDRIIDAIWETDPPDSAPTQVSIHISALRKALADADVIETVDTGFRLRTDSIEIDAYEAERLLAEARSTQRSELFRKALAMWDGPVLGRPDNEALFPLAQRWEDVRLGALDDWAALALDRGEERDLLDTLPGVVAEHPLREATRARLMEALWRCERRADALRLYDEGRRILADELGLDPGHELTRLHQQILREDTEPTTPTATSPTTAATVVPYQLPVDVGLFAGRRAELAALDRIIDDDAGRVIAIHGPGGAGKTTLAVHWAHRHAEQFPDGQLFANLMGRGPSEPLTVRAALESLPTPAPDSRTPGARQRG